MRLKAGFPIKGTTVFCGSATPPSTVLPMGHSIDLCIDEPVKFQTSSNRQGDWAWERAGGRALEVSVGPGVVLSAGTRDMPWGLFGRPEEDCLTHVKERLRGGIVDTRRVLVRSVLPDPGEER